MNVMQSVQIALSRPPRPARFRPLARRAFTLLEVMVAVSILGLALAIILSSQAGLFATAQRTQKLSFAANLARCKMSEVELELLKQGYQLTDQAESGACCEDETDSGFSCEWKVELVELPTPATFGETQEAGLGNPLDLASGPAGKAPGGGAGLGPLDALAKLKDSAKGPDGVSGLASTFQETTGGMDGIASMAFSMVYPTFKPMLEASIRKVTVRVVWREGVRERDLQVIQYVTRPQLPPPSLSGAVDGFGGAPPATTGASTSAPLGTSLSGGRR